MMLEKQVARIEDADNFCRGLLNYRVRMQSKRCANVQMRQYAGEYYTQRGSRMTLQVLVQGTNTYVRVFNMQTQCVWQKVYSTVTDVRALSKSKGVYMAIEDTKKRM